MKLKETDWDAPGGAKEIDVEYPDAIVQTFVNWVRMTKGWLENPDLMERKVRRLNTELADHRNAARLAAVMFGGVPAANVAMKSSTEIVCDAPTALTTNQKRAAGLAKARAAKAAKKVAVTV